jgi:hypothetical protein
LSRWRDLARGPLDETRAWTCLSINLAVLPGLGSVLAGRRGPGAAQALIASVGAGLSTWWLVLLARQWAEDGSFPIDGGSDLRIGVFGVLLFAAAWLWSLATSLSVLRAVRAPR